MKPRSNACLIAALLLSALAVTTTAAQENPSPDAGPDTRLLRNPQIDKMLELFDYLRDADL